MRKLLNKSLVIGFAIVLVNCAQEKSVQPDSPFDKVEAIGEKYKPLTIMEIKPEGWIKKQLEENLDGLWGGSILLFPS
jgi:hypothetical protein